MREGKDSLRRLLGKTANFENRLSPIQTGEVRPVFSLQDSEWSGGSEIRGFLLFFRCANSWSLLQAQSGGANRPRLSEVFLLQPNYCRLELIAGSGRLCADLSVFQISTEISGPQRILSMAGQLLGVKLAYLLGVIRV